MELSCCFAIASLEAKHQRNLFKYLYQMRSRVQFQTTAQQKDQIKALLRYNFPPRPYGFQDLQMGNDPFMDNSPNVPGVENTFCLAVQVSTCCAPV